MRRGRGRIRCNTIEAGAGGYIRDTEEGMKKVFQNTTREVV
jgi:hypothetical protein